MCKAPLARLETWERYTNRQGKISYKAEFCSWADVERNLPYYKMKYRNVAQIGCGNCIECRLKKSRDKANQMYAEFKARNEKNCYFLTLTYNDKNLPTHTVVNTDTGEITEGISLNKSDPQKFIKRLRYYWKEKYNITEISYVLCGEYGDQTQRPHYHMIIYGLPIFTPNQKIGINEMGQPLYTNKELEDIWGLGQISIGNVTWDSCAYVARYIMKKQYGKNKILYDLQGRIPEFTTQSTIHAIGKKLYEEKGEEMYKTDEFIYAGKNNIKTNKPPKSFDKMYEKEHPEEWAKIKAKRRAMGEMNQKLLNLQSSKEPWQIRLEHDEKLNNNFKSMRGDI